MGATLASTTTVSAIGHSQVDVEGLLALPGESLPITLTIQVQLQNGASSADSTFVVPYEKWGVKNPSTFLLRVSDKVTINVHAAGRLLPASPAPASN